MFKRRSLAGCGSAFTLLLGGCIAAVTFSVTTSAGQTPPVSAPPRSPSPESVLNQYCVTCHNERLRTGGLALDRLDVSHPAANADVWERVIGKLRAGSM